MHPCNACRYGEVHSLFQRGKNHAIDYSYYHATETISSSTDHISYGSVILNQNRISYGSVFSDWSCISYGIMLSNWNLMSYALTFSNWNCMSYRTFSPFIQRACKCTVAEDALLTENIILFLDDVLVWSRSKAAMDIRPNSIPLLEMNLHLCKTGNLQKLWILWQ